MRKIKIFILVISFILISADKNEKLYKKAMKIHNGAIVVDGHCDVPMILSQGVDLSKKRKEGDFDLERMEEGCLDVSLFAIFTPNSEDEKEPFKKSLKILNSIYDFIEKNKNQIMLVKSYQDILNLKKLKKKGIMISMENSSPIEEMHLLKIFYQLGLRVSGLTHMENNKICDSSTAKEERWGGLSPYGKELVKEMNKLGIVIDVSHSSDKTVLDVLELSKAPVIASHSCARSIVPIQRNISDELIRKIVQKNGLIMINFYAGFLDNDWREKSDKAYAEIAPLREEIKKKYENNKEAYYKEMFEIWQKYSPPPPKIDKLIEHIEHIIKIAGIDYVGIGSDFEGAGTFMDGLKDVSELPNLTYELLKRGYSKKDVEKILGLNFLRVLKDTEEVSQKIPLNRISFSNE